MPLPKVAGPETIAEPWQMWNLGFKVQGVGGCRASHSQGYLVGGPYNKGNSIWGFILRSPYLPLGG